MSLFREKYKKVKPNYNVSLKRDKQERMISFWENEPRNYYFSFQDYELYLEGYSFDEIKEFHNDNVCEEDYYYENDDENYDMDEFNTDINDADCFKSKYHRQMFFYNYNFNVFNNKLSEVSRTKHIGNLTKIKKLRKIVYS